MDQLFKFFLSEMANNFFNFSLTDHTPSNPNKLLSLELGVLHHSFT